MARAPKFCVRFNGACWRETLSSVVPEDALSIVSVTYEYGKLKANSAPRKGSGMARKLPPPPPGFRYIFRASRKCPATGDVLLASAHGLKAWPILVPI